MAQGLPLLSTVSPFAVSHADDPPYSSSLMCGGFSSCHPSDATNTNPTPPQALQRGFLSHCKTFLRSVCDGTPRQAEDGADSFHRGSILPPDTLVGPESPPDGAKPQVASTGPASLQVFSAGTAAAGTEVGGGHATSAQGADDATAQEPAEKHFLAGRIHGEPTDPTDGTKRTKLELRCGTQPVNAETLCAYAASSVEEPAVRIGAASPTGTNIDCARNTLVYFRQCTAFPADSSTPSGVTASLAAAAAAASTSTTANSTLPLQISNPNGAILLTGNKSSKIVDVTAASRSVRPPAANGVTITASTDFRVPEAAATAISQLDAASTDATILACPVTVPQAGGASAAAALAASTAAVSNPVAEAQAADTAHQTEPSEPPAKGVCWDTPSSTALQEGKSSGPCYCSRDIGELNKRSKCCIAKHTDNSGEGGKLNHSSAESDNGPTTTIRGTTVDKGDTVVESVSSENVERPRLPITAKDTRGQPVNGALPHTSHSVSSLDERDGEGLHHDKKEGCERNDGSYNTSDWSTKRNSVIHDVSSVHGSTTRIINDSSDSSSFYHCNSKADSSSRRKRHGGSTDAANTVLPFTSLVDSCRSTTVSTPSPAASSTPRSVRSGSVQIDRVCCCLISACNGCDLCGGHSSSDNGMAGGDTGSPENGTSLLKWYGISPVTLLGCGGCRTPSPTLTRSSGTLPADECAVACYGPVCRFTEEYRVLMSHCVPMAGEAAMPVTPTKQPTSMDAAREEEDDHICGADKDVQLDPKPSPIEDLLLPAAVVLPRDASLRAEQHQQLPRSPSVLQAFRPIENSFVQVDASVTPAAAASPKENGVWRCSSTSSWSSPRSSSSSPSVFSRLPIVPLSAWPLPTTYVCEDGIIRPQTALRSKSLGSMECNTCSRTAELICYTCLSGDCKSEEIADSEIRRKDLLHPGRQRALGSCHQHLRWGLHQQPLAAFISSAADPSPAELVLPALSGKPTLHAGGAAMVSPIPSPPAAENVLTVPGDPDDAAAFSEMAVSAVSPCTRRVQLPLRFHAESWILAQGAYVSRATAPSVRAPGTSRSDAGFCSSTLRTATLLLGDHDSELTTAGAWSLCDSSCLPGQQHEEDLYLHSLSTAGDSRRNSACSPTIVCCGSNVGVEETCRNSSSRGPTDVPHSCALQATERGDLQKESAPSQLVSTSPAESYPLGKSSLIDPLPVQQPTEWLGGQSKEWLQRQEEYKQDAMEVRAETQGLQLHEGDHRRGQQERQSREAGTAHAVPERENGLFRPRGKCAPLTAVDKTGARQSETAIWGTQLLPARVTEDASAATTQPTRAEASTVDQQLQPEKEEPSHVTVTVVGGRASPQETLAVQPQCDLSKNTRDLSQPPPVSLNTAQRRKLADTPSGTLGNTPTTSDATAALPSTTASAGGSPSEACLVLHATRAHCEDCDLAHSSPGSNVQTVASWLNSEASKCEAPREQERSGAAGADNKEEDLQLLQNCAITTAGVPDVATPSAPLCHKRNKQEQIDSISESRHKSEARTNSRRRSRSSSPGSISSTSTRSGLPSLLTSRSGSTRCSPLSSSKADPLATAAAANDAIDCKTAAAGQCLCAASILHPVPGWNPVSPPLGKLHEVSPTSSQQDLPQGSPAKVFSSATAPGATGGNASSPEGEKIVGLDAHAETTSVAGATRPLHPEQAPAANPAAASQAPAAPPASPEPAGARAVALVGCSPAAAAPAAAASAGVISADTTGAPGRGAADASFPVTEVPSETSKTLTTVTLPGSAAGTNESDRYASHSSGPPVLNPESGLSCGTAATRHHSSADPFLHVAKATAGDGEKAEGPTAAGAASEPCVSTSSTSANTLLHDRIQDAGASGVEDTTFIKQSQLHQASWSRQQIVGNAQQGLTPKSPHVAAEVGAVSGMKPSVSDACTQREQPRGSQSEHVQQALKEPPVHRLENRGVCGNQSAQHLEQGHEVQNQQTDKPSQPQDHRHPWCEQPSQGLVATGVERVHLNPNSNTPLALADYVLPLADSRTAHEAPAQWSRHQSCSVADDNSSSNLKSGGAPEVEVLSTTAADAPFAPYRTSDCVGSFSRSSAWVAATGNTAGSSPPSASQKSCGGNTAEVTGNNGSSSNLFVKDSGCTVSHGYEGCSCRTFPTPTVETGAASLYSSGAPLGAAAGSSQEESYWQLSQQLVCSRDCLYAGSPGGSVTDATVSTDATLPSGALLETDGKRQVSQQLQQGELQTSCSPPRSSQITTTIRSSQVPPAEHMVGGIQGPEAATVTSDKWGSVTAHTQTAPAVQQPHTTQDTLHAKAGAELFAEEGKGLQTGHDTSVTEQQKERLGPGLFSGTAAGGQPSDNGSIAALAAAKAANCGGVLPSAGEGCASRTGASFTVPRYSGSLKAPAFHGAGAVPLSDSRAAGSPDGTNPCSAPMHDRRAATDVELYPNAKNKSSVPEEPQREHLITMSDSRWIALRRSGLFRLGDKGRASIKSRIAKQLRLCPDLRRAAAAIGGGGVRCATTKQLYQLAELCGFDDVLPPEFRRPRASAEQSGATPAGETPAPATGKLAAQLVTTENVRNCTTEKNSNVSSAVPAAFSKKRLAPCEASPDNRSPSVFSTRTPVGTSPRVDDRDARGPYDSIGRCVRHVDTSSFRTPTYTADAGIPPNFYQSKPALISEGEPQQKHPQQQTTPHCVSEKATQIMRQQVPRRPSAIVTMTHAGQHDSAAWAPLTMQQGQWQGSQDNQQHPLQQLRQQQPEQHQPPQQYQQRPQHRLQPKQPQCSQEQHHPCLQQQELPPHTTMGFSDFCDVTSAVENVASEPHVRQQSLSLQSPPQGQPQQASIEEHFQQQQQGTQGHLLRRSSILSRPEEALQHLHVRDKQQAGQNHPEQERFLVGHLHASADVALLRTMEVTSRFEAAGTKSLQACSSQMKSTVEFVGAPGAPAAAVVPVNPLQAGLSTLPHAAASTAIDRHSSSRNDISSLSCSSNTQDSTSWMRKRSTVKSGSWSPGRGHSRFLNYDSSFHPMQQCLLQHVPPQHEDQLLLPEQKQHITQQRPSLCAAATMDAPISDESGLRAAPTTTAASPCRDSAPTVMSGASSEAAAGATGGTAVAGPVAGVVSDRWGQDMEQQAYPLTAVAPAETAPSAAVQSHVLQKGRRLQQVQPLPGLSPVTQNTLPPGASPQSWRENGTSTTVTCGSCSTTSSRSCLAEDAQTMTAATEETPRGTASPNNAAQAAQCTPEGSTVPLLMNAAVAIAAEAAENCDSSSAAGEPVNLHRDAQAGARQEQWPSKTGLPKKRRRVEAAESAASQQLSSPRALSSNNEEQHATGPQPFLEEHDVAQRRQQLLEASAPAYSRECWQSPVLPQGSERDQFRREVLEHQEQDIGVGRPQQRLQLATEQQERVQPHYAPPLQAIQQHPWTDGSTRLPCYFPQLPGGADASRYGSTMNGEQGPPTWKAGNRLETYHQLPHLTETGPQHFSAVDDVHRPQGYGSSTPSWPGELYSSNSTTRCTTSQLYSHNSGSTSSTWVSATGTHVVDEFFSVQSTSVIGCSSSRVQLLHDNSSHLGKNYNGVSC